MKKLRLIVLLVVPVLIIDSFFKDVISKYVMTAVLGILFFIFTKVYCFETEDRRYNEDLVSNIVIVAAVYYILTYLLGLLCNFYRNPNGLSFISVLKNTLREGLYILACEMFRYMVTTKGKKSKFVLIMLVVLLSLCDTSDLIYKNNFLDISDTVELMGYNILPSILKNTLLTYVTSKTGYTITILYRVLFELPLYFVPIIPDLGLYIYTILYIIIPIILLLWFRAYFHKNKTLTFHENKTATTTISIISTAVALCLICLTSGLFRYYAVAVGSGSMTPAICKGDAVVVRKLDTNKLEEVREGQVLAFKHDSIIVVHRITKIYTSDGEYYFCTKGDFNNAEDSYVTPQGQVVGTVKYKIPWVGLPTVLLKEMVNF